MTDHEELIDRLYDLSRFLTGQEQNDVREAADAIEKLSKPRWFPMTERLPKEAGQYLVSVYQPADENAESYSLVVPAWYNPKAFPFTTIGWTLLNEWYDLTPRLRENITHWMPLPEPPKEELNNE